MSRAARSHVSRDKTRDWSWVPSACRLREFSFFKSWEKTSGIPPLSLSLWGYRRIQSKRCFLGLQSPALPLLSLGRASAGQGPRSSLQRTGEREERPLQAPPFGPNPIQKSGAIASGTVPTRFGPPLDPCAVTASPPTSAAPCPAACGPQPSSSSAALLPAAGAPAGLPRTVPSCLADGG